MAVVMPSSLAVNVVNELDADGAQPLSNASMEVKLDQLLEVLNALTTHTNNAQSNLIALTHLAQLV